uniref:Uncharacterized protein n=1 Tax=Arundo donax TaxID=35708 RepID=A0A0A8XNX9_ARUDO
MFSGAYPIPDKLISGLFCVAP